MIRGNNYCPVLPDIVDRTTMFLVDGGKTDIVVAEDNYTSNDHAVDDVVVVADESCCTNVSSYQGDWP